jgi:hypothetical protein
MRLSSVEAEQIVAVVKSTVGTQARAWLFGSRVDDNRRGGDIDLYIETPDIIEDRLWQTACVNAQLQAKLGEQKIDVVLRGGNDAKLPIHDVAISSGIELT